RRSSRKPKKKKKKKKKKKHGLGGRGLQQEQQPVGPTVQARFALSPSPLTLQ
ncbi:unnamed protein product, partial [Sphagnum tenellum]